MDPSTAYDVMTDASEDDATRYDAATALAEWIERGGFLPGRPWSTAPEHFRRAAIMAECADVIERTS